MTDAIDYTQVADEHSRLLRRVDELLTHEQNDLPRALEELGAEIESHFRGEESPEGWLAMVGGADNPQVQKIYQDHGAIRAALRELQAIAGQPGRDEELRKGTRKLVAMFRAHEGFELTTLVEWVDDAAYPGLGNLLGMRKWQDGDDDRAAEDGP